MDPMGYRSRSIGIDIEIDFIHQNPELIPFIAGKDGPAVNVESFCAMPVPLKIIWTFAPSRSPSDGANDGTNDRRVV